MLAQKALYGGLDMVRKKKKKWTHGGHFEVREREVADIVSEREVAVFGSSSNT